MRILAGPPAGAAVVDEDAVLFMRQPGNAGQPVIVGLEAVQQLAKAEIALAPDEEIPELPVRSGGNLIVEQRRMVSASTVIMLRSNCFTR